MLKRHLPLQQTLRMVLHRPSVPVACHDHARRRGKKPADEIADEIEGCIKDAATPSANAARAFRQEDHLSLPTAQQLGFEVTAEKEYYSRYLQVIDRSIRFPSLGSRPVGHHSFDVVGHPSANFQYVTIFAFHPATAKGGQSLCNKSKLEAGRQPIGFNVSGAEESEASVTILREFQQGPAEMLYVLPSGAFDASRHNSHHQAAQAELSEEAQLSGGEWVDLMETSSSAGPYEVKWGQNRMRPWLCIDPSRDDDPGQREAEEHIEVHRVSIAELRRIIRSGLMMVPSIAACHVALDELSMRGLL